MGWGVKEIITRGTGAEGLVNAGKAAGKGDYKGMRSELRDGFWDASTIGLAGADRAKDKAQREAAAKQGQVNQGIDSRMDQSFKTQDAINKEKLAGTKAAFEKMDGSEASYGDRVSELMNEAKTSATDARNVYTGMSGQYADMQERANTEANNAMSLSEYGDVNNKINTSTRGLYNTEGDEQARMFNDEGAYQQGLFDNQATGETRRGQADFGTLAALGSQAAGQGMTGPMTVGQQMAMMAQGQGQAAEAYANTQRRVQGLRDQGMQSNLMSRDRGLEKKSGLRTSGIQAGFDRNDALMAAGESAKNRQENVMRDRRGLEGEFRNFEQNNRGEREGFSQNKLGSEQRVNQRGLDMTNMNTGMKYEMERAKIADAMRRAGKSEEAIRTQLAQKEAETAAYQKMVGGVVGTAGSVVGSIYGGPAGGAAGKAVGDGISGGTAEQTAVAPAQQQRQQPGLGVNTNTSSGYDPSQSPLMNNQQNFAPQQQQPGFDSYLNRKYGPGRQGAQAS